MKKIQTTDYQNQLSHMLLMLVLLTAFFLGLLFSVVQIAIDARQSSKAIDLEAKQMLSMFYHPILTSTKNQDAESINEILKGLMQHEYLHLSEIQLNDSKQTYLLERKLSGSRYRLLTDYIFQNVRVYKKFLVVDNAQEKGWIKIEIDTAYYGREFIQRSVVEIISGIVKSIILALLLYAIYHNYLTVPLNTLIAQLMKINLKTPEKGNIQVYKWNRDNEFGLLSDIINQLINEIRTHLSLSRKAEEQIIELSKYDYLTKLPNRIHFQELLKKLIMNKRNQDQIAVFCLGVNAYQAVLTQNGFHFTELVLLQLVKRIRDSIEPQIIVGRINEDQFGILLPGVKSKDSVINFIKELLNKLSESFILNDQQINFHFSVGITLYPDDGKRVNQLMQNAYFAKHLADVHKNEKYHFYIEDLDDQIKERKKLEIDLRKAISNNEMMLYFQPQIDLKTSKVIGIEALGRWMHPSRGFVSPSVFIPIAEQSNLIIELGGWVIDCACKYLKKLRNNGFCDLKMAINLSSIQLQFHGIVEQIKACIQQYNIPANKIELEITETSIMENFGIASQHLAQLKELGVILALDDFGTGYSSLNYLNKLSFDTLKVDKSFLTGIPKNSGNKAIMEAIIRLGKTFDLLILTEGVEKAEQAHFLTSLGCHVGQGFLYSKPMNFQDLIVFLHDWQQQIR